MPISHKILEGKYGRLTIIEYHSKRKYTKGYHHYYKCKCICGNESIVDSASLKSGAIKSCGCLNAESKRKKFGESAFNSIYGQYKNNAKSRNITFDLESDDFKNLIDSKCYYCNKEPSNIKDLKYNTGNYIYNGIDRLDNNLGYNLENCVPCCKQCNIAKHTYSLEAFKEWITNVYNTIIKI